MLTNMDWLWNCDQQCGKGVNICRMQICDAIVTCLYISSGMWSFAVSWSFHCLRIREILCIIYCETARTNWMSLQVSMLMSIFLWQYTLLFVNADVLRTDSGGQASTYGATATTSSGGCFLVADTWVLCAFVISFLLHSVWCLFTFFFHLAGSSGLLL